jgi:hypothetical protein
MIVTFLQNAWLALSTLEYIQSHHLSEKHIEAPARCQKRAKEVMNSLLQLGHEITSRWIHEVQLWFWISVQRYGAAAVAQIDEQDVLMG